MPTQDEALASEPRTTTIYNSFDDGDVLDERIVQLVELEERTSPRCPPTWCCPRSC